MSSSNFSTKPDSLFLISVRDYVGHEYMGMFEDMMRMFVIQITMQLLLFFTDSSKFPFFTAEFTIFLIYIIIAVMLYWLIFKKIVAFQ